MSGWSAAFVAPSLKCVTIVLSTMALRVGALPIQPYGAVLAAPTSVGASRAKRTFPLESVCGVVPSPGLLVPIVWQPPHDSPSLAGAGSVNSAGPLGARS